MGERNILVRSSSPFIVELKKSFQTKTKLYLMMEFVNGGELFSHLRKSGRFSEERAKFYIAEIFLAINYLH